MHSAEIAVFASAILLIPEPWNVPGLTRRMEAKSCSPVDASTTSNSNAAPPRPTPINRVWGTMLSSGFEFLMSVIPIRMRATPGAGRLTRRSFAETRLVISPYRCSAISSISSGV